MRSMRSLPLALLLLAGCSGVEQLSAEDQLTLDAISGEEEEVAEGEGDLMGGEDARQPLFRACDAQGALDRVLQTYDRDDDGAVAGPEEEDAVADDYAVDGRRARHRAQRWERIAFIYDADDSGDLDDAERATLLEDFDARCEAIHARILEEFDADGDGELSEAERAEVQSTMEARRAERAENCNRGSDRSGPPSSEGGELDGDLGEAPSSVSGAPSAGGAMAGSMDPASRLMGEFDVDQDGDLSAEELENLRSTVRERIRSGEGPRPFSPRDLEEAAE